VRFWNTADGLPVGDPLPLEDPWVYCVVFSPDGKTILTGHERLARLWDVATRKRIGPEMKHESIHGVTFVAFSPDGKTVLTTSRDRRMRLWDVATGRAIGTPMWLRGAPASSVEFSPDGKAVLIGDADGTAQLWDVATRQRVGAPMRHEGAIQAAVFQPDGKAVLIASADGTARTWPTDDLPDDLPRIAAWIEAFTGLMLDAAGGIQPLHNAAWLERIEQVKQLGGPPVPDAGR
jgi:WD40 repeat protein